MEARNAAQHPTMHRSALTHTPPPRQCHPAPKVNSAAAENPSEGGSWPDGLEPSRQPQSEGGGQLPIGRKDGKLDLPTDCTYGDWRQKSAGASCL